jgi:hypothetical protein
MSGNLFKIGTPTRARLAHYRETCARIERGNTDNWRRYVRRGFLEIYTFSIGEHGERFTNNIDDIGEYLGDSEVISKSEGFRIDACGYYTNNDASETYIPGVCKLHTARGCVFIPTLRHSEWDGTTHYVRDAVYMHEHDTRSAIREALDTAHSYASHKAEEAREDDAKFQAEQQTENAREEIQSIRIELRQLIAALRPQIQQGIAPKICDVLRAHIRAQRARSQMLYKRIAALDRDYRLAVES